MLPRGVLYDHLGSLVHVRTAKLLVGGSPSSSRESTDSVDPEVEDIEGLSSLLNEKVCSFFFLHIAPPTPYLSIGPNWYVHLNREILFHLVVNHGTNFVKKVVSN